MTKNNTETRATLLQRVDHLENKVIGLEETIERLIDADALRGEAIRSIRAHVNSVDDRFAQHLIDTLGTRLRRWLRWRP